MEGSSGAVRIVSWPETELKQFDGEIIVKNVCGEEGGGRDVKECRGEG